MNVYAILESPSCARLFAALVHFVWQGFVIGAAAFVAAKCLGRRSARVRYGVYMAALVGMVVAVVVTYAVVGAPSTGRAAQAADGPGAGRVVPSDDGAAATTVSTEAMDISALEAAGRNTAAAESSLLARLVVQARRAAPYGVGVYLAGVLLMLGRLLVGLQGGGRLRRLSRPVDDPAVLAALGRQARALGLAFTPALAYCSRVLVPTVVGVLRPVILLPFAFASGLATEQVEALLAHELAHIRRLDPLLNVVQRVIEAVLFFHPAVWIISRRIRVEREHCCDDMVVGLSASASTYATSLVEAARRGLRGRAVARLAPQGVGLADRPSRLRSRIARLLGGHVHERMRLRWTWLMGLVVAVSVGLVATVSLGGGAADEGQDAAADDATRGGGAGILDALAGGGDADASLQVDLDLQLARIDRAKLADILEKVAPGSEDPSVRPLVLSVEQREAFDAELAKLPEGHYQRLSAPRMRTLNRTKATFEVTGTPDEEGGAVESVGFSCAPVVSADRKSIVVVLFSKAAEGRPAGSLHLGSDAFELPNTDEGGLMAAYRIPNGGTLVLTGPRGRLRAPGVGVGGGMMPGGSPPSASRRGGGGFPPVQLALVRASTVGEADAASRRRILEKLDTVIPEVTFEEALLSDVIQYVSEQMDVNIVVDPTAAEAAKGTDGTPAASTITLRLKNVPLKDVLRYALRYKGLTYVVEDNAIVVVPIGGAAGEDGAGAAELAEAGEAFKAMIEKLETRIPQVDFKDAPLKEVLSFLGRAIEINIVLDPAAAAHLEKVGDAVTLRLKDAPLRDVLKYLLKQKGLTYDVQENAIVVVPIKLEQGGGDDTGADAAGADTGKMKTEEFRLFTSGVRTIVSPDGELRQETIDEWLRRAGGVAWPAGSSITYYRRAETLTVKNAPENMGAIYGKIRKWNTGGAETNPPGSRAIIQTVPIRASEDGKITTAMFNLQTSGTRTVTGTDGAPTIETIDKWLRSAEGVTWPEGSSVVYDARIEMLTVENTPENMAAIGELVKTWEAENAATAADAPGDGTDEPKAD